MKKPVWNIGKKEGILFETSARFSWMTKGKIERIGCTYSDLNENAHLRILLILLLALVPFERTVLPWFVPSQQRGAFREQQAEFVYLPRQCRLAIPQ